MEVVLKTFTEITAPPRSLAASVSVFTSPHTDVSMITLSELGSTDNYQKVITEVKVLSMMELLWVSGGKRSRM